MKTILAVLITVLPIQANKLTLTTIAATTTIAINVLTIRETTAKAIKVAHATRKVVKKTAKKLAGK